MPPARTVDEMLQMAVKAERIAESVYDAFGKMFINNPEVARFWTRYADEEAGHARWMESLHRRASPEQLAVPANDEMWMLLTRLVNTDISELIGRVHNLQDAWDLANELENGETNIIFQFLISNFSKDAYTLGFLRTQLRDHMNHLMIDLPMQFSDVNVRRTILTYNSEE